MHRREFLKKVAAGMAAGWVYQGWPGSFPLARAAAQPLNLGIACLADAHLPDGNPSRPEALSLARAVAEIRKLSPSPHLVFFAGDLAHDGNPQALALGEEILSDLPMPLLAVRGEGDGSWERGGAGWEFFDNGRFFYTCEGVNLLGLDTVWQDNPSGPGFVLGQPQRRWLAAALARMEPDAPLLVLSHAPLAPIYRPWGQWTVDSGPLLDHLARFENVLFLHGHVHHGGGVLSQGQATQLVSLPATSWPLPSPLAGTPRKLRPGLGPRGCGWALLSQGGEQSQFRQVLWRA
jgi:Icc protein